nr:MAG TPA: hypothetical protein [Caudoviricetes sp.]
MNAVPVLFRDGYFLRFSGPIGAVGMGDGGGGYASGREGGVK